MKPLAGNGQPNSDKARGIRISCQVVQARLEEMNLDVAPRPEGWSALAVAIRSLLHDSDDVVFREFELADGRHGLVVMIDGMVKKEDVEERLIEPLMQSRAAPALRSLRDGGPGQGTDALERMVERIITAGEVKVATAFDEVRDAVLGGRTVLMVKGFPGAMVISNPGAKLRPVEKPPVEFSIRGPREGFSEALIWNIALIRRRLRDEGLKVKRMKIGRRTRTEVAVIYIEGVANPGLVREVFWRLHRIDIDGVLDSSYVEQLIEEAWYSPFPTVNGSERPDVVVSGLLEGRVAIAVDNSSLVLLAPATFDSLLHSPEDSYDRWTTATGLRVVRFVASVLALSMPSLYVALASFSIGLMPTKLALRVAASREGIAFPVVIEALIAQFSLELLKEAGLRMPSPVGQIFGVVGGLVLGELGVRAGIFSELMVIMIAVTAVASFSVPTIPLGTAIRLLGLPLMISSTVFGVFGLALGLLAIAAHLVTLRSFGVPYLVPYFYFHPDDLKDTLVAYPLRFFRRRPSIFAPRDVIKQRTPAAVSGFREAAS